MSVEVTVNETTRAVAVTVSNERGPIGPAGASTWDEISGTATSVPFEPTTAPPHSEALVYYDETDHSLTYYNEEADVAVNIGREMLVRVRNNSGATIANGKVVYLSGASGQLPTIELARADSESTSRVIGVATHDIENNSFGYVTTLGEVKGLNTSAFADGEYLYLSAATAGELTATAPSLPNLKIHVATVEHSHVSQGKLYVHPEDESVTAGDVQTALAADPEGARESIDLTPFQRSGGAAAINAALKANRSCGIAVVGDSTGNATDEWVYLLASHIAEQAPAHKVEHRVWSGSAWTTTNIQNPNTGERRWNHPASLGLSAYFGKADLVHVGPDLVVEAKIIAASWSAVAGKIIAQQWGSVPNRNWKLSMGTGTINLQWYESDGTTLRFPAGSSAIPFVDGQAMWVRVFLDVDNGAGQYAVTHYYSSDGVTWTTAGTTTGATGVSSVNAGSFTVEVLPSAFTNGGISQLRVRSSLTGPTENNIAIDNAWRGATSNDEMTLSGDPVLRIDNMSVTGWDVADVTQAQINNIDNHGTLLAFISLSHNEGFAGGLVGKDWTNGIKAIADMIEARCPMAQIVLVGQNPEAIFGTIDQQQIDGHALRIAQLAALAAKEGYGFLNFFRPFHDSGSAILDLVPDGIHPAGAGTTLMVETASEGYDQARF